MLLGSRSGGNEGEWLRLARQGQLPHRQIEFHPGKRRSIPEHVHAPPVKDQAGQVDFGNSSDAGFKPAALRQENAVFRDEVVPGKHQIGGGFPFPGVSVYIGAQQPCGLGGHQLPAVITLTDALIAGGQVGDDGGSRGSQLLGGLDSRPHILADFHPQYEIGQAPAGKQLPGAQHSLLPGKGQRQRICRRGGELPRLIEFAVARQMGFGNQAQQAAPLTDGGAVV